MGSGKQYWPWVHVKDIAGLASYIIENPSKEGFGTVEGIFNAVAPQPTTNEEFTKALGRVLNRPTIIPMPEFALNALGFARHDQDFGTQVEKFLGDGKPNSFCAPGHERFFT